LPTVKKVASNVPILGYNCTAYKVELITRQYIKIDTIWTTKDIKISLPEAGVQGLSSKGVSGMPLKVRTIIEVIGQDVKIMVGFDAVKVTPKTFDAKDFEIPEGYKEIEFVMPGMEKKE